MGVYRMKTGILAICDSDQDYAQNLMEYISEKDGMPFKTIAFTKAESLLEYAKSRHIDILLISNLAMDERMEACDIEKIILLSPGEIFSKYKRYSSIYKYQSTEKIIREILDYYADICQEEGVVFAAPGNASLIGVYSLEETEKRTLISIALSKIYGRENTVLCLCMEEFSILPVLMEREYTADLSDLMYYYKQSPANLHVRLQSVIEHYQGFAYIPPPAFSEDLRKIQTEEWIGLIQAIDSFGIYDYIILGISPMLESPFEILSQCQTVYVPFSDTYLSNSRMKIFEKYLLTSEREALLNQIVKVQMPENSDTGTGQIYLERKIKGIMETLAQCAAGKEAAL